MTSIDLVTGLGEAMARQGRLLAIKRADDGRYWSANAAFCALSDRTLEQVLGRTDSELFDAGLVPALRAADVASLSHGQVLESEHVVERAGRRQAFVVMRRAVQRGPDGGQDIIAVWHDVGPARQQSEQLRAALQQIEEQQRAHEQLRRELADQGLRDLASGLHSRSHFEEHLRRETDLSQREHREYAVVFVALDGQAEGSTDQKRLLLETLGRLLRGGTRAMDASCRWDEQRFAVLLSGVGLATAHSRMEGLRRQCATQIVVHEGRQLRFTVSMGVASFPHTADGGDALLQAGGEALQEAQQRGGNQVTLASIRLDAR